MPIHRTRPTKYFTSIENRVLRDSRLSGEAKGLLAWLLSHSQNWKIIISFVMREMQWGRDKTYRLLRRLQEFGYIYREQERDNQSGSFGEVVYYVYSDTADNPYLANRPLPDSPLPENSKASKRRSKKTKETPPTPEVEVRAAGDQGLSRSGAAALDQQLTTSQATRGQGSLASDRFDDFWNAYDPEPYMSKIAAERAWRRLSEADRQQALNVIPTYIADCKINSRKRNNAMRYLRDKVYQGYATTKLRAAGVSLRPYSPQWQAWHDYMIARCEDVTFMESRAQEGQNYTVSHEWPPD